MAMSKFGEDLKRYREKGSHGKDLWLNPAVWSVAAYRLGHWLYVERPAFAVCLLCKPFAFLLIKFCQIFMEMEIDPQATIGPGLYVGHIGGVHINPGAVLGRNCDIAHRVTIGSAGKGRKGIPVLGNDVYLGTGATLIGRIKVGDGAKIAANTLVISNVPAGATVMGVPGVVIMLPPAPPVEAVAS